jgi:hypothetical protein
MSTILTEKENMSLCVCVCVCVCVSVCVHMERETEHKHKPAIPESPVPWAAEHLGEGSQKQAPPSLTSIGLCHWTEQEHPAPSMAPNPVSVAPASGWSAGREGLG